jgi:hypothetical protein
MKEISKFMGRRTFLTQAGWCVSGAALSGAIPSALFAVTPGACYVNAAAYPDTCGDWTVDHVCSAWPPYSFDTGPAPPHTSPLQAAVLADQYWVM